MSFSNTAVEKERSYKKIFCILYVVKHLFLKNISKLSISVMGFSNAAAEIEHSYERSFAFYI